MLEDNELLALLLLCGDQLLVQQEVVELHQCRALRSIIDSPYPEGEIVISLHLSVILHGLNGGNIAQIMVATDQHRCNILANGH